MIRVSSNERAKLEKLYQEEGFSSMTAYCRDKIFSNIIDSKLDQILKLIGGNSDVKSKFS